MTDERTAREAELARLADRTLPDDRAAGLRAHVERSPELTAALAEQERAVTILRSLDAPAPERLHAAVAAMVRDAPGAARDDAPAAANHAPDVPDAPGHAPDALNHTPAAPDDSPATRDDARRPRSAWHPALRRRPASRWRRALALPVAAALAAAVAVLAAGAPEPTVAQAARFALAAATRPAPAVDRTDPGRLAANGAGIPFPNWRRTAGWTASGARSDTLGGRRITTVFYAGREGRVGYAIVSGAPLGSVHGSSFMRYGVRFTLARSGHARLITWVRDGHTCVIAGPVVSDRTLTALATNEELSTAGGRATLYPAAGSPASLV